jgi:thioredoxin-dependent peroxiredoxin
MLRIGDNAPAFTLSSDEGDQVSLKDFEGKHVVLFFFPKASTPG